jgi:prophage DNA circulation protein
MASGRLSFSIALNLATNQFKQGAEQVKNALRNIQYQVLGMASALGIGGIGLSNLVSRFVDVARETNRARMALRNISGEASTFGKNMSFLTNLAKQYGQDLNTLTTNFARFSAASNAANVGLADQYKIYSAVTEREEQPAYR